MDKLYVPFDYKKAEKIAERTKAFYAGEKGKAQIHVKSCGSLKMPPAPKINAHNFPQDMEVYLDKVAERAYQFARFHESIEDDFIPTVSPFYGIAEHTAFLGGKVDFEETTTFQHQICAEFEDISNLKLNKDNLWIHLVAGGMKHLREKWGAYIPVRLRGADGPSDIANAIRGNDLFYDIYDYPDELGEMMDFCAEAVEFTMDLQKKEVSRIGDGFINGFGIWMPENSIGHLSEDFSTMISTDVYEEFFYPALQKLVKSYDMAMLHVHSLGQRMIPYFAAVPQINIMEISSDPGQDRAVEVIRKYHDVLQDKVIVVAPTYEELVNMGDILESSKTVIWYYAQDEEDAKRALAAVEKYR
jgi:hypothetical protein